MSRFIVRRLISTIPLLVLISIFTFSLILLLPGDPALAILGDELANANNKQAYYALRAEMGLDDPIPIQYLHWAGRAIHGDFGTSIRNKTPIGETIITHVGPTLELAILAALISVAIAFPAGIISALKPNSLADFGATLAALGGVAVPHFFLGILLIYAFAVWLHVLPPSGYVPPWEDLGENLKLMLLPAFTIGTGLAAILMRQVRSALLEVLQQDYILTARSKGLAEWPVVLRHAFKNAAIPVVTIMGQQVGTLIGGAVITETIFSIPGMGRMIVESIFFRDFPVIQASVLVLALSVLLANLTTDIVYGYLDPRIRHD
ncbi:MAG: ABC transporter permease [Chloroflexi bacterium]|nr:ABC transporter permease [Chloroflexota bacterium]